MSGDNFAKNTLAPLILRLALAAVFIYHGVEKITGTGNDWGTSWARAYWERQARVPADVENKLLSMARRDSSDEEKENIGNVLVRLNALYNREIPVAPGALQYQAAQMAVAWGELLAGVLLLVGFGSRLSAAVMFFIQLGAIFTVTWARGFSFEHGGGYEYNLVLLAMCLAVFFLGGGPFSLSGYLRAQRERRRHQTQATPTEPVKV